MYITKFPLASLANRRVSFDRNAYMYNIVLSIVPEQTCTDGTSRRSIQMSDGTTCVCACFVGVVFQHFPQERVITTTDFSGLPFRLAGCFVVFHRRLRQRQHIFISAEENHRERYRFQFRNCIRVCAGWFFIGCTHVA